MGRVGELPQAASATVRAAASAIRAIGMIQGPGEATTLIAAAETVIVLWYHEAAGGGC